MVTVDLEVIQRWDELLKRVEEAGEVVRVTRGGRDVAIIQPSEYVADDAVYLNAMAELGARQIAETFPAGEYAKWDPKADKNGPR